LSQKPTEQTLRDAIFRTTKEQKPATVRQLTQQMVEQFQSISEKEVLDVIVRLQNEGKLQFTLEPAITQPKANQIVRRATWYWITMAATLVAVICIFTIPEDDFPAVIIRYVFGAIFILWLPGYAFIKALFPQHLPFASGLRRALGTSGQNLDIIERVVLSLGMSLALVPIVGLLLNYTPWGIRLTPITLSLAALTFAFSTAAIIREYQTTKLPHGQEA